MVQNLTYEITKAIAKAKEVQFGVNNLVYEISTLIHGEED